MRGIYFIARCARLPACARLCPSAGQGGAENAEKNKLFLPLRTRRLCGEKSFSGFSLIEVLVAMAIMTIIIVMVTNMFRDASEAWDMGTQRAEMNTSARAAIEYISRELSHAMAGTMPHAEGVPITLRRFKLGQDADGNTDNLSFISLSEEDEDDNALCGTRFRFVAEDHIIQYCRFTGATFDRYDLTDWDSWQGVGLLITNVWSFEVTVSTNEDDMRDGKIGHAYDSSVNLNLLPACVDISIEMLGERDMARALSLDPGPSQDGFVMTNSRVYTTRVCFPNRGGR